MSFLSIWFRYSSVCLSTASSVEYSPSPSQSCNSNNMSTRYAVERESTSHLEETRRARMRRFQNHNGHDDPRHSESAQHTSTCIDDINGSRNPFQPFLPTPNTQSRSGRGGYNTMTSPNQDVPRSTSQRQHGNPRTFRRFENASNFSVNVNGREIPNFVGDVYEYSGRPNSTRCEPRSEFPSHTSSRSAYPIKMNGGVAHLSSPTAQQNAAGLEDENVTDKVVTMRTPLTSEYHIYLLVHPC